MTAVTWAVTWGCAESGAGEYVPTADPSMPQVDASWTPAPIDPAPSEAGPHADASDGGQTLDERNSEDGAALPSKPSEGEVLITEVMYDPSTTEPVSEWFEVHNLADSGRTLSGLSIVDGAMRTHVIGEGVVVPPGGYVVLVRNESAALAAQVPASAIVYEYGGRLPDNTGIQLANGPNGGVSLREGTAIIAAASYGGWFAQPGGSSVQLKTLTYAASVQSSSWCVSSNTWTSDAGKGTPGAPGDCP